MLAVAYTPSARFPRAMARPRPGQLTEAQRLGLALRALRRRQDLSQAAAAERANTHQQTWQRYEAGENDALLKVNLQRRLSEAIGSNHEELMVELARFGGVVPPARPRGMSERPLRPYQLPVGGHAWMGTPPPDYYEPFEPEVIDLSALLGDDARVLRLAGESMIPYAEPGGFVVYNLRRYPRRGQGCVIELEDGEFHVKRYERLTGEELQVTELHPKERQISFPRAKVKGVYAVGLRGD